MVKNALFEYENAFYLNALPSRLGKAIAHCDLYRRISHLQGAIVECGIFKGASFCRWAMFRELFETGESRRLIGFDVFGQFPETRHESDLGPRQRFVDSAGELSITKDGLLECLRLKNCDGNVTLVEGDITKVLPEFCATNPQLRIALLNLDTDIYEPAVTILEQLWPRIVTGGILLLDDYGVFPGETKAVDDYFQHDPQTIEKLPFAATPSFIVKRK
jgi:hypothetical protein